MSLTAAVSIVLHVANYNATAQLEHKTRIFSKVLGKNAIYIYAVYLVISALIRDRFIQVALIQDQGSLGFRAVLSPYILFGIGTLLNFWTLSALGIKGMYNGDSFGYLMEEPVTTGPYRFLNEPQYVGTSIALLGSSLYYDSLQGLYLTFWMYAIFSLSVEFLEKPHMLRLYSTKNK